MELLVAAAGAGGFLTVLISTFGPSLTHAMKYWMQEGAGKRNKAEAAEAAARVHHILNDAVVRLGSKRALILYTENGGGVPKPGLPIYVTVLYEMFRNEGDSIREHVQRIMCDGFYCEMISNLLNSPENKVYLITRAMPRCYLKGLYEKAGTELSVVIYLRSTRRKTFYVSFNFPHANLSDAVDRDLDLLAHELKAIYAKV